MDEENQKQQHAHLDNGTVQSLSWAVKSVSVRDRKSKARKNILSNIEGSIESGELLAIIGPSGSGKTTFLNVLAQRYAANNAVADYTLSINGAVPAGGTLRQLSSFVEQEENFIGSLTVKEALLFAAKLSLPNSVASKNDRLQRVQTLLSAFGLNHQSDSLIGTPIRRGISGGQKRRLSVASHLIAAPKILFLDEPTSGLDSAASLEVVSFLRDLAKAHKFIVVASIHQPSAAVFRTFDKLHLLSNGRTAYYGSMESVSAHFQKIGFPIPSDTHPAEYLLELAQTDFDHFHGNRDGHKPDVEAIIRAANIEEHFKAGAVVSESEKRHSDHIRLPKLTNSRPGRLSIILTLTHRSLIKSYRDVFAYGIRIAMYMGLAIMMGTVWLRLSPHQSNIQPFINAIFFGSAFLSFMAVAYIPAFLEDRAIFVKERANGIYGPLEFMIVNLVVGLPFLFIICILFSILTYWLIGFQATAVAFWKWIMWLYLDLLAAESLVVLIASLIPIFVVSLAATAFANGLWMSVGGFLVPPRTLNVFWRYVFHYIDFQAYCFQGMMVNEFSNRVYDCAPPADDQPCHCMYSSELESQCKIDGKAVLASFSYHPERTGIWVSIMIAIIVAYRILGLGALWLRRT